MTVTEFRSFGEIDRSLVPFIEKLYLDTTVWEIGMLISTRFSWLLGLFSEQSKKNYIFF